jgi:hypothetical protein
MGAVFSALGKWPRLMPEKPVYFLDNLTKAHDFLLLKLEKGDLKTGLSSTFGGN